MRALPTTFTLLTGAVFAVFLAPSIAHANDDDLNRWAREIEQNPDDVKTYETYAKGALEAHKPDEAIAKLKLGVAHNPEFAAGYYLLGYAYRQKQAWVDAAVSYRTCIALKWKENDSYFGLGKALVGLGDKRGAEVALKRYVAQEKRPQAQRFIDEANADLAKLSPAPTAADTGKLRADADQLRNDKKFEEAAVAYKRAIEADKKNLDLYNDLGNVYFSLKKYGDAASAFKAATDQDGKYALGWYNLAHALRKAERKAEAVDAYQHYIKIKPEDPDPYYGLGQTLKLLGDAPGAIAAFHKYVEMEKREGEQKWVEKARQELAAMEAAQHSAQSSSSSSSGKVSDDK